MDELDELEQRVGEKWAREAWSRTDPQWQLSEGSWEIDTTEWNMEPLPDDVPQFPREQWASYPIKRRLALMLCENLLDSDSELTDEQWMTLCVVMQYGGKTRIA